MYVKYTREFNKEGSYTPLVVLREFLQQNLFSTILSATSKKEPYSEVLVTIYLFPENSSCAHDDI